MSTLRLRDNRSRGVVRTSGALHGRPQREGGNDEHLLELGRAEGAAEENRVALGPILGDEGRQGVEAVSCSIKRG